MKMTAEYKKFRRESGMASFERECRSASENGRLKKAYLIPGLPEAGTWAMFMRMANDAAEREGWKLFE